MKRVAYIFSALCLLQLGAGLSADQPSQSVGRAVTAQERDKYDSTVVDTAYSDFPYIKRAYNWGAGKVAEPSVPFVDLDTNTYEKKLWFSEKKLITPPIECRRPKIVAQDSLVYVVYSISDTTFYVYSIFSLDHGENWLPPQQVHYTGQYRSGSPRVIIDGEFIYLVHSAYVPDFINQIWFRSIDTETLLLEDSVLVDTTSSSSDALFRPHILAWSDTLFVSYGYIDGDAYNIAFKKSSDFGTTWVSTGNMLDSASYPYSFLLIDTVLSVIYSWENTPLMPAVNISRSFNGGETWEPSVDLSDNGYASQRPAASLDGVSDLHVVWYDFEGAPPGWGGYTFYRNSHDAGETWSETKSLSLVPYCQYVEIWADTNWVYAAWNEGSEPGSAYLGLNFRWSRDRGESWSPVIGLVPESDPAWYVDIYADGDLIYLVWGEQDPPEYIWGVYYMFGAWYLPGDVDYSGEVNVADLTYFVDYLFFGGDEPFVPDAAEMNGEPGVNVADLTYLVDYLFFGGPPPVGGTTGF